MIKQFNTKIVFFAMTLLLAVIVSACVPKGITTGGDHGMMNEESEEAMMGGDHSNDDAIMNEDSSKNDSEMMMNDEDIKAMMNVDNKSDDEMVMDIDVEDIKKMITARYSLMGSLNDVSGGSISGVVQARFINGEYDIIATFKNLPEPSGTDFYEGWIVRPSPLDVISTGRVEKNDRGYINVYKSGQDLSDHTLYVLTIEPDDGDLAPASHVLEGTLISK